MATLQFLKVITILYNRAQLFKMTLLVNNSLKFQTGILQIHCYFLLIKCNAKDSHFLSTKNNSVVVYVVGIYLMSSGLSDDVKLTKF